MDISKMGGKEVYAKYLAFTSKKYANVPLNNMYKSAYDYYGVDGAGNWGNDLFHYCTIDTLKCITEKKQLRFTDVRFLNDTTEYKEAIQLLKSIVESKKSSMYKELYNILLDKKILLELEDYFQRYPFKMPINCNKNIDSIKPICRMYTCSFSMNGDLLPMWNYYAHGAGGVSIHLRELEHYMEVGEKVKLIWGKVWYEEEDKIQCVEELLKDISELFPLIPSKKRRKDMIQTVLITAMNNMRIFMKNKNFSTENEYRAVLIVPEEVLRNKQLPNGYDKGHFNRGNIIIPYIDVPFDPESINRIVVGSGAKGEFSLIKLGLEDWLLEQNLDGVKIYPSNIPLRKY